MKEKWIENLEHKERMEIKLNLISESLSLWASFILGVSLLFSSIYFTFECMKLGFHVFSLFAYTGIVLSTHIGIALIVVSSVRYFIYRINLKRKYRK